MATIVNNPPTTTSSNEGSSMGVVVGVIIALVILALVLMWGVPFLRGTSRSGVNVDIPKDINVNVNRTPGTAQ